VLPIIPVTSEDHANKLSVQGSFQTGSGFADQYSALTEGAVAPSAPSSYAPDVDPGMVTYDSLGDLHTIDWKVFLVGMSYFFPNNGNLWISANYSQLETGNITSFGIAPTAVFKKMQWYDVVLYWNITPAWRLGGEYAFYKQTFGDNSTRSNYRGQFSAFYIF